MSHGGYFNAGYQAGEQRIKELESAINDFLMDTDGLENDMSVVYCNALGAIKVFKKLMEK